jgi:hypothetical protein
MFAIIMLIWMVSFAMFSFALFVLLGAGLLLLGVNLQEHVPAVQILAMIAAWVPSFWVTEKAVERF